MAVATPGSRRYVAYTAMFLLMAISYIDRVNLAVAAPAVADAFDLSKVQLGYVLSSYLWTYLVLLVPLGVVVDRWGARVVGGVGMLVWSVGGAATGLAGGLGGLLGARLLLGAGEAASYPVGGRVIQDWAPPAERGRASAWLNGGAYAGLAVGAVTVGWLVAHAGWRESFYITGGIGLVAAIAWYFLYRAPRHAASADRSAADGTAPAATPAPEATVTPSPTVGLRSSLGGLLRSRTMWGLALTQGCAGYTLYLFLTWLPSYLVDARGLDVVKSGLFSAVPYAVAVVLGLALGKVSDSYVRRSPRGLDARRRLIAGCFLSSAVILITPFVDQTWLLLVLFSISLTSVSTVMGLCIALTHDLLRDGRRAGAATSFLIFGGNSFGFLAPIITGYLIEGTGTYSAAFLLAGALLLLGSLTVTALTRRPIDGPADGRDTAQREPSTLAA